MIQVTAIEWPLVVPVVTEITWRPVNREDDKMQVMPEYPRTNVTLPVKYTFRKLSGGVMMPVSLMEYESVSLMAKKQGSAYSKIVGTFDGNKLFGGVAADIKFSSAGTWNLQFVAAKPGGTAKIYGEPLQVEVAKNVDELATDDVMEV